MIQSIVEGENIVNGEQIFFWTLLAGAGYMFVTAGQFSSAVGLFPRIASGVVLCAGVLRLAVTHLDIDLQENASTALTDQENQSVDETDNELDMGENVGMMIILGVLITGYIIGGYLVGLFWVTPLFVVSYMVISNQPHWKSALWTIALTGVAYGFMVIMNLDLMKGAI